MSQVTLPAASPDLLQRGVRRRFAFAGLVRGLRAFDLPCLWLALACLLFVTLGLMNATDGDYWWHLRTGELIVEERAVPRSDPFSYTAEGKEWVPHEWLSEVLIYALQSAGGYAANVVVFVGLALGALLISYKVALSFGVSRRVAVALFAWAGVMSIAYWMVRPQVFTWFLLAVFLALIIEHRNGRNRLWLLPPLMVLWANLHLGYAFGLGVVALYALALFTERLFYKEEREVKPALLAFLGCVAATLLTPFPGEILLYPLDYLRPGNVGLASISEWQTPNFHVFIHWPLALAIGAFAALGLFGRRRDLFLPALGLVFTLLALQASRNQPLFAVVFLIVAPALISDRWPRPAARELMPETLRPLINLSVAAFAAVAAGVFLWFASGDQLHSDAKVTFVAYPKGGAAFIRENHPDARLFNLYNWGGYLIHELYPRQKVFVDGRSDMYGDALLRQYLTVEKVEPGWRTILDERGVSLVITGKRSSLSAALDEADEWGRVFTGPVEAVFVRRSFPAE